MKNAKNGGARSTSPGINSSNQEVRYVPKTAPSTKEAADIFFVEIGFVFTVCGTDASTIFVLKNRKKHTSSKSVPKVGTGCFRHENENESRRKKYYRVRLDGGSSKSVRFDFFEHF